MEQQKTRRLAAIMFTDIVGYTALMQRDETEAAAVRAQHRSVFKECHEKHHGEILQYFGDGTLSVFQSGVEAVACAIAIQQAMKKGKEVPLRIGLHQGDIVFDGTEIYGDGVNLASRIESISKAGAILLSEQINEELKNHPQISTTELGRFELKNIAKPVAVYAVNTEGIYVPPLSELSIAPQEQDKSIAVLPFVNMSSSEENEFFSDGMTEEIINALAKIKNLKVSSRTSSFFFKNKNIPIPQIGHQLKVSTILEGSIRLSGNKMRITAQLIDVSNDFHFWSETFDRSFEDVFAVQDEISLLIADRLREHLGHLELDDHLVEAPPIPVEIYKRYLQGRYFLTKLGLADVEKGIEIMKEVIAAQPDFTLAYLGINQGYTYLGTMGMISAADAFAKAKPFLDKAIELDEDLPDSQLNLAWISCWQKWDLQAAYDHLSRALEVRPSDQIYLTVANILSVEGKFAASMNYADQALALDPLSAINTHFKGFVFYLQENYQEARVWFDKSLELNPRLGFPKVYSGQSLILRDRKEEALEYFRAFPDDPEGELDKLGGMAMAHAALGNRVEAEAAIDKLNAALETEAMGNAMKFLIFCHTLLGQHDEAIELIERGISFRLPILLLLYTEPLVKPLRSNKRFQELMQTALGPRATFKDTRRKYKKPLFDPKLLKQYRAQLSRLMQEEKPYLDPNLTLRSLAEQLDMPPNYLSQLLNEGFDQNFAEFVNTYRLETFKIKAADPKLQHLTILALALESGFNSKTVFNTFFKKIEGKTPRAYWKELHQQ